MPEVRLIDANAFLERILPECRYPDALKKAVDEQPTIEPKRGEWIEVTKHRDENGTILIDYECSECFAMVKDLGAEEIESERFCYNCGADMRGGADNGSD